MWQLHAIISPNLPRMCGVQCDKIAFALTYSKSMASTRVKYTELLTSMDFTLSELYSTP